MKTIKELREDGLFVKVRHNRNKTNIPKIDGYCGWHEIPIIKSKGGFTEVSIFDKNDNLIGEGKSICSNKDNYDKKMGIRIALGRAMKNRV